MNNPLISIGMPVYNCERTLSQAIRSVLLQTYENWELILIDDGSTDDTQEVAKRFIDNRIHIFKDKENRGLAIQLNKAISLSKGKYFARMDGDDVCYPERFQKQVQYLQSHPEVHLIGTNCVRFKTNGTVLGKTNNPENHLEICAKADLEGIRLIHPTFMGHLKWFQNHPYNETYLYAQDSELLFRTCKISTFANIPDILLGYRDKDSNMNRNKGRWNSIWRKFRYHILHKRYDYAIGVFLKQGWKGHVESIAMKLGFRDFMMRHFVALPLSEYEKQKWIKVWSSVQ